MANTVYFDRAHIGFKSTGGDSTSSFASAFGVSGDTYINYSIPMTVNTNCILESGYFYGFKILDGTDYAKILVYDWNGTLDGSNLVASSDQFTITDTDEALQSLSFSSNPQLVSGHSYVLGLATYISGSTNGSIRVREFTSNTTGGSVGASYRVTGSNWVIPQSITGGGTITVFPPLWVTYTGGVTATGASEQRMMLVPTSDDWIGFVGTGTTLASGLGGSGTHYNYVNEWETFATTENYVYNSGTINVTYNLYNFSVPTGNQAVLGNICAVRLFTNTAQHNGTSASGMTMISISGQLITGLKFLPSSQPSTCVVWTEYLTNPFNGSRWNWALISGLKAGHGSSNDTIGNTGVKAYATWIDVIYKPFIETAPVIITPDLPWISILGLDPALTSTISLSTVLPNIIIEAQAPNLILSTTLQPDISLLQIFGTDPTVLLGSVDVTNIDIANIRLIGVNPSIRNSLDIEGVDGGLFTNASNFLYHYLSQYLANNSQNATIRDRFPFRDEEVEAPLICYESEFSANKLVEMGSNLMNYRLTYLVDVVGNNKVERDTLLSMVQNSIESANSQIQNVGDFQMETFDIVGLWQVRKENRALEVATIRIVLSVYDFI